MAQGKKLTALKEKQYQEVYLEALSKFNGIDTVTLSYLQGEFPEISWHYYFTFRWNVDKESEFYQRKKIIKDTAIDKIENVAWQKAISGDTQLIKFMLERLNKDRFSEKIITDNKVEHIGQISINIIKPLDN